VLAIRTWIIPRQHELRIKVMIGRVKAENRTSAINTTPAREGRFLLPWQQIRGFSPAWEKRWVWCVGRLVGCTGVDGSGSTLFPETETGSAPHVLKVVCKSGWSEPCRWGNCTIRGLENVGEGQGNEVGSLSSESRI